MVKRSVKIAAVLLTVALCVPWASAARGGRGGDTVIRVGLASSSPHVPTGELEAAHLENNTGYGAGYRFGYFDEDLDFVELASTDEDITQVAVLKTQNLYYGNDPSRGKTTYSSAIDSSIVVGCYHVLVEDGIRDPRDAQRLAERTEDGFVAYIDGQFQVRAGSFERQGEAEDAVDRLDGIGVVGTSSYGMSVVETGSDRILFQYDEGQEGRLAIMPDVTGADAPRTWFNGWKYQGGFQYHRRTGGDLTVTNVLPLEDYLNGVICYEMGREWPLEALKAQALCARTYALKSLGKHDSYGFDICNSASCQVYNGVGSNRSGIGPSETSMRAVEETAGEVVLYDGRLAETPYSSSHGGASEDAANVWGTDTVESHPYLSGVIDPYEADLADSNSKSSWTVTWTARDLTARLQSYGHGLGTSIDYLELLYSEHGNVIELIVHWTNGQTSSFYPSGTNRAIRSVFMVDSIRFTINGQTVDGESGRAVRKILSPDDKIVINGSLSVEDLDGLYAISGGGRVSRTDRSPYAITGRGKVIEVEDLSGSTSGGGDAGGQGSGTVVVSDSTYVFEGSGYGHQLGMSQYGANAMARRGFTGQEIVEFYFPGTYVGYYD